MAALSRLLALLLAFLLAWESPLSGQAPTASALQLQIISGTDRPQVAGRRQSRDISVRVVDAQNRGIADVNVTFQLPGQGISGTFPNGSVTLVATTNSQGEASATGIQWGPMAGTVTIRVVANKGTDHAGLILKQELALPAETTAGAKITAPPAGPMTPGSPATKGPTATGAGALAPDVQIISKKSGSIAKVPENEPPAVTISSSGSGGFSGRRKWIILCLVAGAAGGVAVAMLSNKKSSPSAVSAAEANTIGSPTLSIGPH